MADAYYTVQAEDCDEMGRLFRDERLVARVGDRVPTDQAQTWGLLPEGTSTAAPGPETPPARRRTSRNREKGHGSNR